MFGLLDRRKRKAVGDRWKEWAAKQPSRPDEIADAARRSPIQSLWIGERLTTMEVLSIRSFLAHGHPYHLYTYGPITNVPEGTTVLNGEEILPRDRFFLHGKAAGPGQGSVAGFADLFRYHLLYEKGGIWADTDIVCLKPFAFASSYVIGTEMHRPRDRVSNATNCLLKTPAGSELAKFCCEFCASKDPEKLRYAETAGALMKAVISENKLLQPYLAPHEAFCPIHYFNFEQLLTPGLTFNLADSYGVHLWNEIWRRRGYDKDKSYDPRCLYEQLKARYIN